jgi:diguanylate cyclase (GGDEF)-like protein
MTLPSDALMILDVSTLVFAGGLVSLASGVFLLLHWLQTREDRAAFISGAANFGAGIGVVIIALQASLPGWVSTILAPLIFGVCSAGIWAAARIFNRGSIYWRSLTMALAAAIAIPLAAGASGHDRIAAALGLGSSSALFAAGALEFWLGRGERLRGRWPMIALQISEAIALFLAAIEAASRESSQLPSMSVFGIIHFVALVYAGGSAISLITMLKDRSEIKHRAAALIDPLTGLANRRAFMDWAQSRLAKNMREDKPISLLAFDIDNFKQINDNFGHPTGDRVLRIFADVLSNAARPADIAARIGGEEFALALPDCATDAALAIAQRIRSAFQDDAQFVNGQSVKATVSVGVGVAPPSERGGSLGDLIAIADGALYRAKKLGRNRVTLAIPECPDPDPGKVIRVA